MRPTSSFAPFAAMLLTLQPLCAADFDTRIFMKEKAAATYYVPTHIEGADETEFMVDTGSGYVTINERTLHALKRQGTVRYVKQLQGVLANGDELAVPIYRIAALNIGGNCRLRNVEVAVFPGDTRQILGLSALRKAAPFIFSVDPPSLVLSHCGTSAAIDSKSPVVGPLGAFE